MQPLQERLVEITQTASEIAQSTKKKLLYFLIPGVIASVYLAWLAYSFESEMWSNIIRCGLILLPALVWCFIWNVLSNLQDAPKFVTDIAAQSDDALAGLQQFKTDKSKGLRSLFALIRDFKNQDGLETLIETIGGITLLANPLFALFAFICLAFLLIFIILAPVFLLFL